MVPLSILDLSPIVDGGNARQSLHHTLDLARHAEAWGYRRFWLAEHHNMPGIASAATSVVMAYVAGGTSTIRVGAGGIMLPNHAPLVIAEQFGTLESLFPGRIDLGLGRAPGSDPLTAQALRRGRPGGADGFPRDVAELMAYFRPPAPNQRVRAVPGAGLDVPIWILGSSLFGAELAASLGLPYAFASHFAPQLLHEALALYRAHFQSDALDRPHVMLGVNAIAADEEREAYRLSTSLSQAFINLRSGRPGPLPAPVADYDAYQRGLNAAEREVLGAVLPCTAIGSATTVRQWLEDFAAKTGADELILASAIFDHAARLRSYELVATGAATA